MLKKIAGISAIKALWKMWYCEEQECVVTERVESMNMPDFTRRKYKKLKRIVVLARESPARGRWAPQIARCQRCQGCTRKNVLCNEVLTSTNPKAIHFLSQRPQSNTSRPNGPRLTDNHDIAWTGAALLDLDTCLLAPLKCSKAGEGKRHIFLSTRNASGKYTRDA